MAAPSQPTPSAPSTAPSTAPSAEISRTDRWLEIGRIVAAQGMQGEVRIYPESDFPERFLDPGPRWYLPPNVRLQDAEPQPITLEDGRELPKKNLYVLRLSGIHDRDAAEAMRGAHLYVPASDRPTLEDGEYHLLDLLDLPVYERSTGQAIGRVAGLQTHAQTLLEVRSDRDGSILLIPFVDPIVPIIDLQNRRIEITPPPGLLPES